MVHGLLLLGSAAVIYVASEWFVNAVEWLGWRLRVAPVAVGTVLAAIGTALPESVVTLVAVLFGGPAHGADLGMGAALGGPLVVGTLAYAATGLILLRQPATATAGPAADPWAGTDTRRLVRDQSWFLAIFVVKISLGLVAFAGKSWLGLLFFATYAAYLWREVRPAEAAASADDLAPLRLQRRRAQPAAVAIVAQTLVSVVLVFSASQVFVRELQWAGPALGLSATVVALLLSPVATELPEIMNAVIWVRQGKTQLALANISGAMMIQATVPSGIGLLFTPWRFDRPLLLAGLATIGAVVYLRQLLRSGRLTPGRLAGAATFYLLFAAALALWP